MRAARRPRRESALERVYAERLRLHPGAERSSPQCARAGVKTLLVSGGFTFFTDRLKAPPRPGLHVLEQLEIDDGRLTGGVVGAHRRRRRRRPRTLRAIAATSWASPASTIIAIGDGANDLPMLAEAGLSVAYRAKPVVKAKADCALDYSGLDAVFHLFE